MTTNQLTERMMTKHIGAAQSTLKPTEMRQVEEKQYSPLPEDDDTKSPSFSATTKSISKKYSIKQKFSKIQMGNIGHRDTTNRSKSSQKTPTKTPKTKREYLHSYYMETKDNENDNYSYQHSRVKDKLVYYQNVERLLPRTIPGQFAYFLLNIIFSSDLYYSFHNYSFDDGFKSVHRIDDFFTSRRICSIQRAVPGLFPSKLWYQIIKYEPTPYKSMCYYQDIRQKDSDKLYKLPLIFGYAQMILVSLLIFVFCINIADNVNLFNFLWIYPFDNIDKFFLFSPFSLNNLLCYALIAVTFIHILLILIVFGITWFLQSKIADYKSRIAHYLSRRRQQEIESLEVLFGKNQKKMAKESQYRIFYKINSQSYLHYKRNGELFISLLKWLNVIEYEQDLDFFTTSKRNWVIISFAMHKYFGILLLSFICLFGINFVSLTLFILYFFSYWIHFLELYASDHHDLESKSNQSYNAKSRQSIFTTLSKIFSILLWPGCLIYATLGYCAYIIVVHHDYFPMIWLGVAPIWLIIYSVLTRGYRRIYMFNGCALFMLYLFSINWFLFRIVKLSQIFRELSAVFLLGFLFFVWLSLQFETHRAMLFPQLSLEYKRDDGAKKKFGLSVDGAAIYASVQYAAMYFPKSSGVRSRAEQKMRQRNMSLHGIQSVHGMNSISPFSDAPPSWWNKWYFQRLYEAMTIPKPNYPFTYRSGR